MTEEETTNILQQQTEMIEQLAAELETWRGKTIETAGPFAAACRIILNEQMHDRTRTEAAGLVLERDAPEAVTEVAERYLNAVTKRTDLHPDLVLDACKHLAKRHVPKAALPGTAAAPSKAERARLARRLMKGRARLDNADMMDRLRADNKGKTDVIDDDGHKVDLAAIFHSPALRAAYAEVDALSDDAVLSLYPVTDNVIGMANRLYAARMHLNGLNGQMVYPSARAAEEDDITVQ